MRCCISCFLLCTTSCSYLISHQLTIHDCVGSASKRQRVASDSAARRPPISPLIVQVHDDQSKEDAEDTTHLSLPTSTCSPSPCTILILSYVLSSSSDDHGSPSSVASFSSLEENKEFILVKGIVTHLFRYNCIIIFE